jgi:hypothetical protein
MTEAIDHIEYIYRAHGDAYRVAITDIMVHGDVCTVNPKFFRWGDFTPHVMTIVLSIFFCFFINSGSIGISLSTHFEIANYTI